MTKIRYQFFAQNTKGDILPGAVVTVRNESDSSLATIYSDSAGTAKTNPFNADADGYAFFYAEGTGLYRVRVDSASRTFEFRDITLPGGGGAVTLPTVAGRLGRFSDTVGTLASTTALFESSGANVGVGTTSPSAKLHVRPTTDSNIEIGAPSAGVVRIEGLNDARSAYIEFRFQASPITFYGNGVENLRVHTNGYVGIGTSSPGGIFEVRKDSTYNIDTTASMRFTNATTPAKMFAAGYDGTADIAFMQSLHSGVAYKNIAINPSGGNVGIGTITPAVPLDLVATTSGANVIHCKNTSSTGLSGFNLYNESSQLSGWVHYSNSADALVIGAFNNSSPLLLQTNNATRLAIDNSGNVGLGTTSPSAVLDVNSDTTRLRSTRTPASATAAGNQGDWCYDTNYLYVCVATNTWKRAALATW